MDQSQLHFGAFRLDLQERQLLREKEIVPLTAKAFEVLAVLVQERHRTVTKDELIRAVWHDTFVSEESLTQAIYVLRRALGDDSAKPEYIATVARRGYRFVASVSDPAGAELNGSAPAAAVGVEVPGGVAVAPSQERASRLRMPLVVATVAVVALALGALAATRLRSDTPARPLRFTEHAPAGTTLISGGVVSPDGARLAFVARDTSSGRTVIFAKTFDSGESRALAGTEGAFRPFWSPDSRMLGFFADGRLKTVSLEQSPVRVLATVGMTPTGGTWGPDLILFTDITSVVYGVSPAGGTVRRITELDESRGETWHRRPQFLPDGRHFLFSISSESEDAAGTYVGNVDDGKTRIRLFDAGSGGVTYANPDLLLFVRDRTLMAQRFDVTTFELSGAPAVVAANVVAPSPINSAVISASETGLLTFGGGYSREHLAWFDRDGRRLSTVQSPPWLHDPVLSGDGTQLLAESADPDTRGLWRIDVERGSATRLLNAGTMAFPSPDGETFAFSAQRGASARSDLFIRSARNDSAEKPLLQTSETKYVSDWSRDGRLLLFVSSSGLDRDVWVLPRDGSAPTPLLNSDYNEVQASLSPDGRWLAYTSDESGAWEVYVQAFPSLGQKRAVSVGGGAEPLWRNDGRELYYLSADHTLTAVDVTAGTTTLTVGKPRPLFRAPISWNAKLYRSFYRRHYAATADGQRFAISAVDDDGGDPLTVLVNWPAALRLQ